jgi:hypothetical protein
MGFPVSKRTIVGKGRVRYYHKFRAVPPAGTPWILEDIEFLL